MATSSSIAGSSSGIDTSYIVSTLVAAYRAKYITPLETKKTVFEEESSALSNLTSLITTLQGKVKTLRFGTPFSAMTATSSNESVLTAAADSTAVSGTHSLNVTQLAAAHQVGSGQFTSTGTGIVTAAGAGAKTFQITINGTSTNINVTVNAGDSDETVLTNIAGAITSAGIGASATVVHESGTTSRLVVTSSNTGTANAITMSDVSGGLLLGAQVIDGGSAIANELTAAKDALFTLDGLNFTRSSNTVSDAITGVTMKFKAVGASTVEALGDTAAIQTAMEEFITAYNAVVDALRNATEYDPETEQSGDLLHYSSVRNMNREMRAFVADLVAGLPDGYNSLAAIGIDTTTEGKLEISDQATLTAALTNHLSDVKALIFTDANSVSKRLSSYLTAYNDVGGILPNTATNIKNQIASLLDPLTADADDPTKGSGAIPDQERRLAAYESSMILKFSALDTLLTTNQTLLNSLSGFSLLSAM